jgi:flagellar biosynthetic protein FlhB
MAEQTGEKSEAPTPKRRQEARERGQVARSMDLTAAVVILASLLMLSWTGGAVVRALQAIMQHSLSPETLSGTAPPDLWQLGVDVLGPISIAMLPILGGIVLAAIIVNLVQVGFLLSSKRITPNLGAINPIKGIQKIFGGGRGPVALGMNVLKLTLVSAAGYSAVHGRMDDIVASQVLEFGQIFAFGAELVYDIGMRIALILLVLAIIDYAWQRFDNEKKLKMTKQEVKDEMKNMEGDPQYKQRRRQIQLQRAMQRAKQSVPSADVIVTNPTEYAVALKYDAGSMSAPRVVAKGTGYVAQRIREIAAVHGIPIIQRPPLARALFRLVEVGGEIPEQFYNAVAEILAYVYQLTGRSASPTAQPA